MFPPLQIVGGLLQNVTIDVLFAPDLATGALFLLRQFFVVALTERTQFLPTHATQRLAPLNIARCPHLSLRLNPLTILPPRIA